MSAGPRLTRSVDEIVSRLLRGGLAIVPTETVYGLAADVTNPEALDALIALKGRAPDHPLPVQAPSIQIARPLAARWSEEADRLARAFWPGPLTIVVPKAPSVPETVSAGLDTVGIRCPDHPLTLEVLRRLGRPIAVPSANPSGQAPPTDGAGAARAFPDADVPVLDGGPCREGLASTVITVAREAPRILRDGALARADIERVLGVPVQVAG